MDLFGYLHFHTFRNKELVNINKIQVSITILFLILVSVAAGGYLYVENFQVTRDEFEITEYEKNSDFSQYTIHEFTVYAPEDALIVDIQSFSMYRTTHDYVKAYDLYDMEEMPVSFTIDKCFILEEGYNEITIVSLNRKAIYNEPVITIATEGYFEDEIKLLVTNNDNLYKWWEE